MSVWVTVSLGNDFCTSVLHHVSCIMVKHYRLSVQVGRRNKVAQTQEEQIDVDRLTHGL